MSETKQDQDIFSNLVSVDDHVVEAPNLWWDRLSKEDRERGPHVVRARVKDLVASELAGSYEAVPYDVETAGEFVDLWHYEDLRFPMLQSYAAAGQTTGNVELTPITYDDMRPGCYRWQDRLADMDSDGVQVSLAFPNIFVRFCGQRFKEAQDKDLALRCVQAYNDWLEEEWSAPSNGRLYGAAILPLWDPALAVAELERIGDRVKTVCFSEIPPRLGLPSIYSGEWDALFRTCEETDTLLSMHIGSTSSQASSSPDCWKPVNLANTYTISSLSLSDWLVSGILERFPKLKFMYAEAQGGWIPYLALRLDRFWEQNNPAVYSEERPRTPRPPSAYLKEHVYVSVFDDPTVMDHLDIVGVENVCFETDYPHPDGTFPDSRHAADLLTKNLSTEDRDKVLRHNGLRLLGLE